MTNGGNFDGLPDIITSLINSPQIAEILKNSGVQNTVTAEAKAAPPPSAPVIPPDIMEKLPQIMAALSGSIPPQGSVVNTVAAPASEASPTSREDPKGATDANELAAKLPQVINALSSMGGHYSGDKNRKTLLRALKPYMNERKCHAIDKMLELDSMAEIMMLLMGRNK